MSTLGSVIHTNRRTDEASPPRLTASSALSRCSFIVTFSPVYQSSAAGTFTLLAVSELCASQLYPPPPHTHSIPSASLHFLACTVQCICPAVCVWEVNYLYCQPPSPTPPHAPSRFCLLLGVNGFFLHSLFLPRSLFAICEALCAEASLILYKDFTRHQLPWID